MKEVMDAGLVIESDKDNFANRKLIRPTLPRAENHGNHTPAAMPAQDRRDRPDRHDRGERMDRGTDRSDRGDRPFGGGGGKKAAPPEQTNAENFSYKNKRKSQTPREIGRAE